MRERRTAMSILWYRWLALLIGAAGFVASGRKVSAYPVIVLCSAILYTGVLTFLRLRQWSTPWLWMATAGVDVVMGGWLLAVTGGAESAFLPFFLVPIVHTAMWAPLTAAVILTVGLGVLYPILAFLASDEAWLTTLTSVRFLTGEGILFLLALLIVLLVGPVLRWRKLEGELANYESLFTMTRTEPDRVMSVITAEALRMLKVDIVLVFLYQQAEDRLELQFPDPFPMFTLSPVTLQRMEWDQDCLKELMASAGPATVVDQLCRISIPQSMRDFFLRQPFLSAPIVLEGKPIGLLLASRRELEGGFEREALSGMAELAGRIAQVVRWIQSLHRLQRRYTEVSALNQVLREINSPNRLESVLQRIVDSAAELLRVDRATVMLLDEGGETLRVRAVAGASFAHSISDTMPVGEGISGWVVRHGQSLVIAPEDISRFRSDEEREVRRALCTPLRVEKRSIGVLNLSVISDQSRAFAQEDVEMAQLLADTAAVAIVKADLMEKVLSRTQELGEANREMSVGRTRLAQTINCISDGVIVLDATDRVILLNDAARRLLDLGDKEVLGLEVGGFLKEQGLEGLQALLRRLHDEATTLTGPLIYRGPLRPEVERSYELQMTPVCADQDDEAQCEGIVTILRDVTVEPEEEPVRSEFITTMAHELRTPLTSMRGYLELLRSGDAGTLTSIQEDYISRAQFNLDRCINLVSESLDLSRIREGHFSLYFSSVDVPQVVQEVAEAARVHAETKQLELRVTVSPEMAPIVASSSGLRQVLMNLLDNAIKHTPSHGQVSLRVEEEGNEVRFAVQDTGVGINGGEEQVFQPAEGEEGGRGVGLGLHISKQVVEAHNGRIWFESEPGRGTVFYFSLPKDPAQVPRENSQGAQG